MPDGTELTDLNGYKVIKAKDMIDEDIGDGYLGYGFTEITKPADLTLNEAYVAEIGKKFILEDLENYSNFQKN